MNLFSLLSGFYISFYLNMRNLRGLHLARGLGLHDVDGGAGIGFERDGIADHAIHAHLHDAAQARIPPSAACHRAQ